MQIPVNSIRFFRTAALDGGVPCEPIRLVQYDKTMPVAAIALTENGVKYTPPSGALFKVRMKKADGKGVYNDALGLSDSGEVLFLFTQQMTAAFGQGFLNVEVTLPDTGAVKCSDAILVFVAENAVQEGQIESADEFLTLVEILELCKKLAAAAQESAENAAESAEASENSATLSKSWAVGGTGTRPGEDTDNSKYYAGEAERFKTVQKSNTMWMATAWASSVQTRTNSPTPTTSPVRWAHRASKVRQAQQAPWAPLDPQGLKATQELPGRKVLPGQPAHRERRGLIK